MTIFNTLRLEPERMGLHEFASGTGELIGASASETLAELPLVQAYKINELSEAQRGDESLESQIERVQAGADPADVLFGERPQAAQTPIDEARKRVKDAGLDAALKLPDGPTIPTRALDIMLDRAKGRQERAQAIARGPSGILPNALAMSTSFLVGALDPLNIASAFIPVIGEARYAKLLADATSLARRAGVSASVGAASGAVGVAALQPLDILSRTQEGQDWHFSHSLQNVLFGAGLGATLMGGGRVIGDVTRSLKGRPLYPFGPGEPLENALSDASRAKAAEGVESPQPLPAATEHQAPVAGVDVPEHPLMPETRMLSGLIGSLEEDQALLRRRANLALDRGEKRIAEILFDQSNEISTQINAHRSRLDTIYQHVRDGTVPSRAAAAIIDLPPRAQEDAMRGALANLIDGEPVRAAEMLQAASRGDTRIAESLGLASESNLLENPAHVGQAQSIEGRALPDVAGGTPGDGGGAAARLAGRPGGAGAGEGARGPGAGDRAARGAGEQELAAAFSELARARPPHDEPAVVSASAEAKALPEPGSLEPGKVLKAAQEAEQTAKDLYRMAVDDGRVSERDRIQLEEALTKIDQDAQAQVALVRQGAACLGAAAAAASSAGGVAVKFSRNAQGVIEGGTFA